METTMYGKFVFNEILFDIRDRDGRLNIQIEFLYTTTI